MDRNRIGKALEMLHEGPQDLSDFFLAAFSRTKQVAPGGLSGRGACLCGWGRG
ncbi:hypothetical protein I79_008477 [Cricetulus griseus]|uniref:Uncharacterized protein n=1 Tax=Cricetulus griseus TaxID=10029 RepID=G3HD98_CRIGR|nr:hypothetical protein I79_008477 [Cricetulus griseus]